MPLGLALTGLALMIVALCLQRRWNRRQHGGALSLSWFERELPKHEKQEKRASGL